MNTRHFSLQATCRLCGTQVGTVVPLRPLAVASPNVGDSGDLVETAPADICQCPACGFLQLPTVVNPEFQYRNFRYVTGISVGLREHFAKLVGDLAARGEIRAGGFVFDIGSNDGSLLSFAKARGARVLGIDPAERIAQEATAAGIPTIGDFFTSARADEIVAEHGRADIVISNNTVANIDDLSGLFDGIARVLSPHGLLVIETQYAVDVLDKFLLDVVYHEHVSYFAVSPTHAFLAARGMELVDAERIAPKGGSIRFYIQHRGGGRSVSERVRALIAAEASGGLFDSRKFDAFSTRIAQTGVAIRERLEESRRRSGRAIAFGSSVGCAALMQYFELATYVDAVYDDIPLSDMLRTADGNVPIRPGVELANEPTTDVLVLAWRYADNIARKHSDFVSRGGRFYRAIPELVFTA